MKRFFHVAVLAAIAAFGFASLTETVPAESGVCQGSTFTARAFYWATVSSCAELETQCLLRVLGAAKSTCERKLTSNGNTCQSGPITFGPCTLLANGEYKLECQMRHKCESGFCL